MTDVATRRFRVVLGDLNDYVRTALTELLDDHPHLYICATAASGDELVNLVKHHQPDLALFDFMSYSGGDRVDRALRAASPQTVLAVFTAGLDRAGRQQLVDSGIDAIYTKGAHENLAEAVHSLLCS